MKAPFDSAARDDRTLVALRLRRAGLSLTEVAAHRDCDLSRSRISVVCHRVRDDDLNHPDPGATPDEYRRAYPW